MATRKVGPYSIDELVKLWASVVDDNYSEPLVEQGDGSGFELVGQAAAQFARVSEAINRTLQAMFILPWSGQTDEPGGGQSFAHVELTFERTARLDVTLTFEAGDVLVEEAPNDHSLDGSVEAPTERVYVLLERTTLGPGERGPVTAEAIAEQVGYGYNNPEVETITKILQPGAGLQNDLATVTTGAGTDRLLCDEDPDVVVAAHVGGYLEFTVGANTGQVRRVVGYRSPEPGVHGGVAVLARTAVFHVASSAGAFIDGEVVEQATTLARASFVKLTTNHLIVEQADSSFDATSVITGLTSGATVTPDAIIQTPGLIAEAKTAGWRALDWGIDLGVTVENDEAPTGGKHAILDELGAERRIARSPGEDDDTYRKRIATLPDVVCPNAIRRITNRIIAPFGASACLREVGLPLFRGLFFDGDPDSTDPRYAFAYDLDFTARPRDRFKVLLDLERFRAYFEVGLPRLGFGEFGVAYDAGPYNAFDAAPFLAFFDGFPVTAAIIYRNIWQAVNEAKAAGVGFDLYVEDIDCT